MRLHLICKCATAWYTLPIMLDVLQEEHRGPPNISAAYLHVRRNTSALDVYCRAERVAGYAAKDGQHGQDARLHGLS